MFASPPTNVAVPALRDQSLRGYTGAKSERGLLSARGRLASAPNALPTFLQELQKGITAGSKSLEEELYDFAVGRKAKRWQPDRRPEHMRGKSAGPGPDSKLSWGGAENTAMYEDMAERMVAESKATGKKKTNELPLGSAATALTGESGKADSQMDGQIQKEMIQALKPEEESARYFEDAVELAELIQGKYGRYYDAAIMRNAGQVAFNLYGAYLGQRTFPYTEEQYLQKLTNIVILLNDVDQAWYVKKFLLSPIAPRNGLPSTPRSDTAVTLRLNLSPTWNDKEDPETVETWFMMQSLG
eukprot:gnl/TRDRNA2_/TRDRNA2_44721_c0_seq1.p1 gnl/TRDRNA2_/TRDRNA2_44721_c0~~gnl/TRDRNA2_/TRDRNA2_44721_c0_seq1.p1  ORF type:complete len:307 (+),score=50.06 gnl/TRDRNA2_/TRDRNA2_44721_c0_seq1:23-922(+)